MRHLCSSFEFLRVMQRPDATKHLCQSARPRHFASPLRTGSGPRSVQRGITRNERIAREWAGAENVQFLFLQFGHAASSAYGPWRWRVLIAQRLPSPLRLADRKLNRCLAEFAALILAASLVVFDRQLQPVAAGSDRVGQEDGIGQEVVAAVIAADFAVQRQLPFGHDALAAVENLVVTLQFGFEGVRAFFLGHEVVDLHVQQHLLLGLKLVPRKLGEPAETLDPLAELDVPQVEFAGGGQFAGGVAERTQDASIAEGRSAGFLRGEPGADAEQELFVGLALGLVESFDGRTASSGRSAIAYRSRKCCSSLPTSESTIFAVEAAAVRARRSSSSMAIRTSRCWTDRGQAILRQQAGRGRSTEIAGGIESGGTEAGNTSTGGASSRPEDFADPANRSRLRWAATFRMAATRKVAAVRLAQAFDPSAPARLVAAQCRSDEGTTASGVAGG